jgi:hypothetical protein
VLTAPNVLVPGKPGEYVPLVHLGRFTTGWDSYDVSALSTGIGYASPQLQAEALVVLGTPAMVKEMFEDDCGGTRLPRFVCAAVLGALAEGLCKPADDSSTITSDIGGSGSSAGGSTIGSSSKEGGGALAEVSLDTLLQLTAAMPGLLRSVAEVITPCNAWDVDTGYDTDEMLATAGKLIALAHRIAAYTSSIRPAQCSTAQLLQLNTALDAMYPAASTLIAAMPRRKRLEVYEALSHWPDPSDTRLFSLLVERLATQQQPAAGLITAVAAGLADRCCSASAAGVCPHA